MSTSRRNLEPEKVIETAEKLLQRINERFPDSGLKEVSKNVLELSREAESRSTEISKPYIFLRAGLILIILLSIALFVHIGLQIKGISSSVSTLSDFIQMIEAATNELILLGAIFISLLTIETRMKRKKALAAMHEIRSLAHIIDMHQLTKDPSHLDSARILTISSPTTQLNKFMLNRYLDYCSELLSLLGKIAAIFVQRFSDPVLLNAVDEIESLTNGLSRKVWQKIMIIQKST